MSGDAQVTFSGFWQDRAEWPLDWSGAVFFGRALDAIGRAMYPDEWSGNEFAADAPPDLPPALSVLVDSNRRGVASATAKALLRARDPAALEPVVEWARKRERKRQEELHKTVRERTERALRASGSVTGSGAAPRMLAGPNPLALREIYAQNQFARDPLWDIDLLRNGGPPGNAAYERAREIALAIAAATRPYQERARAVEERTAQACLADGLETYFLGTDGQLRYCDVGWWAADRAWRYQRAVTCKIDPLHPMSRPADRRERRGDSWLFVGRESLSALLPKITAPQAAWAPAKGVSLTHWARKNGPADEAARTRLKVAGNDKPTEADVSRELAAMWNLSAEARGVKATTGASVAELRRNRP